MIDCIRNGATTIFDHHSSPGAVTGSLFRIAEAARLTGLRSCLCYEVTDRDGAKSRTKASRKIAPFSKAASDPGTTCCADSSACTLRSP